MNSPLTALHSHVSALISVDTRSPISPDGSLFDFTMPFPGQHNFKQCDLMLQVEVEWFGGEEGVALEIQLRRIKRNGWGNPVKFFSDLSKEVELFLHSCYISEEDCGEQYLPEGWLYPRIKNGDKRHLTPAFSLLIPYSEGQSEKELFPTFNSHLLYACSTMWLAAPVFQFVLEHRREPSAAERLRLISIAHGTVQVLRPEGERDKDAPPPVLHFPEGFYSGRKGFKEMHLNRLRPQ